MRTETDYKKLWLGIDATTLENWAFRGGETADQLSHVFIAAYQAAIHATFKELDKSHWICFAASEDKSGVLPGVSIKDQRLSGTKTWVASSDLVEEIIVYVDGRSFLVSADASTVNLETYPDAKFLPGMSQGRATLSNARPNAELTLTMPFNLAEAYFVTCAACGYLCNRFARLNETTLQSTASDLFNSLSGGPEGINPKAFADCYEQTKGLGKQCGALDADNANDWQQNGRLLGLYSKPVAQRAMT